MAFPLHRFALAGCLVWVACRDDSTRHQQEPPPDPKCGDGRLGADEECDGSDLGEATCASLGFETGSLTCDAQCKRVTLSCVKRCGNGVVDLGEECDGALGPLSCPTFGYKACSSACAVDASHCISEPFAGAPALQLAKGGPAIIADLSPRGFGDLLVAVPSYLRLESFPYTLAQGFVAGRKISFGKVPELALAADLDGDGEADLAAINADGTVDRYRYAPASNTFPPESYPPSDAGIPCPAFAWVGVGKLGTGAGADLVALGCPSGSPPGRGEALLVFQGGATAIAPRQLAQPGLVAAALGDADQDGLTDLLFVEATTPELKVLRSSAAGFVATTPLPLPFTPSAIAAGDLDGDGDLDLLAIDGSTLKVLENAGSGFAERYSASSSSPLSAQLADLDLDGRPDLVWLEGGKLKLRRNAGSFQFTAYETATGTGAPLNLALGDVDADGDLDFAATYSQGGDATVSYLVLNKVR